MTLRMTKIAGVPDRGDVRPGMGHYAGSGPPGKTCGTCQHRGYYDEDYDKRYGCAMFRKFTSRHGPAVNAGWSSCKYYQEKSE